MPSYLLRQSTFFAFRRFRGRFLLLWDPEASFIGLLEGKNFGKLIINVAD